MIYSVFLAIHCHHSCFKTKPKPLVTKLTHDAQGLQKIIRCSLHLGVFTLVILVSLELSEYLRPLHAHMAYFIKRHCYTQVIHKSTINST